MRRRIPNPEANLIDRAVLDSLISYDVATKTYHGQLAESWTQIDNKTMELQAPPRRQIHRRQRDDRRRRDLFLPIRDRPQEQFPVQGFALRLDRSCREGRCLYGARHVERADGDHAGAAMVRTADRARACAREARRSDDLRPPSGRHRALQGRELRSRHRQHRPGQEPLLQLGRLRARRARSAASK